MIYNQIVTWTAFAILAMFVHAMSPHYSDQLSESTHMGQFPQDGENGQNLAFIYLFWSSAVTKRFDFFNFSQLY